ncbi:MAG: hypothetical protein U0359_27090 [Byssovorax sp.]
MKIRTLPAVAGAALFGVAAALGWVYREQPIPMGDVGLLADLSVLAHKDSAYTSITWVTSKAGNLFQLRCFKHHEGEVCLSPSWDEYAELARKDPRLAHLVPQGTPPAPAKPDASWPYRDWLPSPGTLVHTPYNLLYPAGVLLNPRLMAEGEKAALAKGDTKENAYRYTKPRVLVVGLGSGSGLSMIAHHFPEASMDCVDIDPLVVKMVTDYYPFIRWLTEQKTSDGRPRLHLVAQDARQYIRYEAKRAAAEHPYDIVILDAYAAGGTIPSHLMTKEFFEACADVLGSDGILMSNTIGAYAQAKAAAPGKNWRYKHLVLGGAFRTMRAAGLPEAYNVPINKVARRGPGAFVPTNTYNNITLASKAPVGPDTNPEGWARLKAFVPYPELPLNTYVGRFVSLYDDASRPITSKVEYAPVEKQNPGLRQKFQILPDDMPHLVNYESSDPAVIAEVIRIVRESYKDNLPAGWDRTTAAHVAIQETDWVHHAREVYDATLDLAKDPNLHSGPALVGPLEGDRHGRPRCIIPDAPLFTDARPNADIFNN